MTIHRDTKTHTVTKTHTELPWLCCHRHTHRGLHTALWIRKMTGYYPLKAHMLGIMALKVLLMLICRWIYEKEGKRIWQRRIQLIPSAVKVLPRVRRHACNLKANARQLLSTWQCIKMTELSSRESRTQLFHQGVKFRGGHLTQGRLSQYILNCDATVGKLQQSCILIRVVVF